MKPSLKAATSFGKRPTHEQFGRITLDALAFKSTEHFPEHDHMATMTPSAGYLVEGSKTNQPLISSSNSDVNTTQETTTATMAEHDQDCAALRTFAVPELLEMILVEHAQETTAFKIDDSSASSTVKSAKSLFVLQRVCKQFRDAIATSLKLQRLMLKYPVEQKHIPIDSSDVQQVLRPLWWLFEELEASSAGLELHPAKQSSILKIYALQHSRTYAVMDFKSRYIKAPIQCRLKELPMCIMRREASWRQLKVCSTPGFHDVCLFQTFLLENRTAYTALFTIDASTTLGSFWDAYSALLVKSETDHQEASARFKVDHGSSARYDLTGNSGD